MEMLISALLLPTAAGVGALFLARLPRVATFVGAGGTVLGCLLGLIPTVRVLSGGAPEALRVPWGDAQGAFSIGLDSLSAFFLLPVFGLSALAAVYGGNYLLAYAGRKSLGGAWFFCNIFIAGMVLVVLARTVFLFLVAWEVMSISAYCLVTFEHEKSDVRRAGWIYLVATHLGVVFLFLAFLLLGEQAHNLEFSALRANAAALTPFWAGLVFVFFVIGFGAKAGFVPFHVWLPDAHPAAPSHVSALMSGVMIKMGVYGILRVLTFLGTPAPWWGVALGALGLLTGLLGITLALGQKDIKRVLAYSSIENMGLIALAFGVGLWGLAEGEPAVAVLGMAAGLLHVWNHVLMKGLMFLSAGSVLHGTGTRDMEQLGGLARRMPCTGAVMIGGAVAISALPPLNGFVSKWLLYLSLMDDGLLSGEPVHSLAALFAVALVALIGGLTALTFVRLTGITLLGSPRAEAAEHAHDSSVWMLGPMLVLIVLCVLVAIAPILALGLMSGVLDQVLAGGGNAMRLEREALLASLGTLGTVNACTLLAIGAAAAGLLYLTRRAVSAAGPTWGCGYARPTERMQYTGRSFAEMLAELLVPAPLRPRKALKPPGGLFPAAGEFASESPDPLTEQVYQPLFTRLANRFSDLRILQQGRVNAYLLYIMLMVIIGLGWLSLRAWM